MLSTLAIISIFAEIFAAFILLAGVLSFASRFLKFKQQKDLALSFVFLTFLIFIGLMIASQLFYNIGKPISTLILFQKAIAWDLAIGSLFMLMFIKSKFKLPGFAYFILIYSIAVAYMCYRIAISSVDLIYRLGVIEPIVNFSLPTPVRLIWGLSWLILSVISFVFFLKQRGNLKTLLLYNCISALLIYLSYPGTVAYVGTQNSYFLLLSWAVTLAGVIGLTLSEIIPPDSDLAKNPLNFLRSRILFKLIFIFVLLIVILFEATTVATLILSRQALQVSIFSNYIEIAQNLAQRIQALKSFDEPMIQKMVTERRIGRTGIMYVVDSSGKLIAHPDMAFAALHPNLRKLAPVQKALTGNAGAEQFPKDEFGEIKIGAYSPIKRFGGAVVVEEHIQDAYYRMRQLETNSLLFIIAGIILTVLTGLFLAQSIENPIQKLISGTEALSKGNLSYRIDIEAIDELGLLAAAFNRMTHDLKDSQERLILSEKLASLGTMAAGMAHEIKNPLVSLRTFSQLLQQKWTDPEFREKFAQIVPTEIERINKIAESLLKFGRPVKPEMGKVNINSILEEILMLFESECRKNGIRVSTKLAELPEITGDMQQLSQAFVNVILNAIQAMENGGELIIKTDTGEVVHLGQIKSGAVREDGSVVWGEEEKEKKEPIPAVFIEITDTGQGISSENIKSLFDPFFTTKAKGTGMGLPITLRIIEEHKGSIKVKSEAGKGTTFIITLPQKT